MTANHMAHWWTSALLALAAALHSSSAAAQTIRYAYDDAGRMTQVTAPAGRVANYTYDAAGLLIRTERRLDPVDGVEQTLVTHRRHDLADRTTRIAHVVKRGDTERVVAGQALTRSGGGTIERIDTFRSGTYDVATGAFSDVPAVAQAFRYDDNARLTEEVRTQGPDTTITKYEYDAVGNRKKKEVSSAAGIAITSYAYNNADQLVLETVSLPAGGGHAISYAWDGNGNLASKTEPARVTLYSFDAQNRLSELRTGATQAVAQSSPPTVAFAYDANGNRVRKLAGASTEYLIDPSHGYPQVALETSSARAIAYVRGNELEWQTTYGGMMLEHLFPLLGHAGISLGAVTEKGVLAESIGHDAFGVPDSGLPTRQSHLYAGEYWDSDLKLLYLRARWYDPSIARFISPDPHQGHLQDPRSLHRYAYAHNDPVNKTDPSGLFAGLADIAISSTIRMGGGIGGAALTTHLGIRAVVAIALGSAAVYHASGKFKTDLEDCIQSAKIGEHKCRFEKPTFFLGDDTLTVRDHVADAVSSISPSTLSRSSSHGRWYTAHIGPALPCSGAPGVTQCDEYPFNAANEGGPDNYPARVSLRSVAQPDNSKAGGYLGAFYGKCEIPYNGYYRVVAVRGIANTGYVCGKK